MLSEQPLKSRDDNLNDSPLRLKFFSDQGRFPHEDYSLAVSLTNHPTALKETMPLFKIGNQCDCACE